MSYKAKWMIIPVDSKQREFHGKLLLACYAAIKGYGVVFGGMERIRHHMGRGLLPTGIILEKTIVKNKNQKFQQYKKSGFKVVAVDEEGLVYHSSEIYQNSRVDEESLKEVECFFAWGSVQAKDILEKAPDCVDKVLVTGNPRFDILREPYRNIFADEMLNIRSRFPRFILINTNFGTFNHYKGHEVVLGHKIKQGRIKSQVDIEQFNRKVQFQMEIMQRIIDLIPKIGERFPDHHIIVRPHPSENQEVWKDKLQGMARVNVIFEGSAISWILASDLLIQNGCTTAIEAYLLGKPVIAYRPLVSDEGFDNYLPNALSIEAFDDHTVLEEADMILKDKAGTTIEVKYAEMETIEKTYIDAVAGPFSSEKIIDQIDKIDIEAVNYKLSLPMQLNFLCKTAVNKIKGFIKLFLRRENDRYKQQIFGSITKKEVRENIGKFGQCNKSFKGLKVRMLTDNCFIIHHPAKTHK